jgi:hypothetical protein
MNVSVESTSEFLKKSKPKKVSEYLEEAQSPSEAMSTVNLMKAAAQLIAAENGPTQKLLRTAANSISTNEELDDLDEAEAYEDAEEHTGDFHEDQSNSSASNMSSDANNSGRLSNNFSLNNRRKQVKPIRYVSFRVVKLNFLVVCFHIVVNLNGREVNKIDLYCESEA